jgi:asparagine synthase (glutamine-hydrolysing)
MREVCYLHLTRFVQILLDRKDRMSMAHGLEVRVPFCDHRLVEYVYDTPWEMKTFDGREKSLLRAAVVDLLPGAVLERRKSPYPSTQDPAYLQARRGQLQQVLADASSPVLDLLDRRRVSDLVSAPGPQEAMPWQRIGSEMVLGLDRWLRRCPVRLDLAA